MTLYQKTPVIKKYTCVYYLSYATLVSSVTLLYCTLLYFSWRHIIGGFGQKMRLQDLKTLKQPKFLPKSAKK